MKKNGLSLALPSEQSEQGVQLQCEEKERVDQKSGKKDKWSKNVSKANPLMPNATPNSYASRSQYTPKLM
jgi:hypothetical protein